MNIKQRRDGGDPKLQVDRCCTIPGLCACNSSSSHDIPFLGTKSSEWRRDRLLSWAAVGLERVVVCKLYAVLLVGGCVTTCHLWTQSPSWEREGRREGRKEERRKKEGKKEKPLQTDCNSRRFSKYFILKRKKRKSATNIHIVVPIFNYFGCYRILTFKRAIILFLC